MTWKISYTQHEFRQVFPVSDFRSERSHGLTNLTRHRTHLCGWTRLSHRIRYFFIRALLMPMLRARRVNRATRGFLWNKWTPNYIQGTRQHWLIFLENRRMNLGDMEYGDLENTFGTIRPLRPVQTQISMRIPMSVDDITFTLTV